MSRASIRLVIFDLTGTTVRDEGVVVAAYRAAFREHGLPFEEGEITAWRGASKLEVFRHFTRKAGAPEPETLALEAYATFQKALADQYASGSLEPIEGAEAALRWLRAQGILCAINTGLDAPIVEVILRRLGWAEDIFDCVITGDEVPAGRPAPFMIFRAMERLGIPDPRDVLVVGDTALDLQAGVNAGAGGVVGVLTGAHGIEILGATRHTHILPSVAALPDLLEREF